MKDLIAAFKGISTPLPELYREIEKSGWEIRSVRRATLNGKYVVRAKARNQYGEFIEKFGPDDKTALANLLVGIHRHTHMRTSAQWKLGMWQYDWTHQLPDIAHAYAKAPVYDPKAALAWKELADDSTARANAIRQQLHVEETDDPEPYKDAKEMADDIHNKRHFYVSRANTEHPVWTSNQNIDFRVVHDVLGHAVSGGGFDWAGENLACRAHFPLLSPNAQRALFTECIGQTGYANHYRGFGPQKVAFLDNFLTPAQQQENAAAHRGVHPSQSIIPTSMPAIQPGGNADEVGLPTGTVPPHQEALGLTPVMNPYSPRPYTSKIAGNDPYWGWYNDDKVKSVLDNLSVYRGTQGAGTTNTENRPVMYDVDDKEPTAYVGAPGAIHQNLRDEFGHHFKPSRYGDGPDNDLQYGVISPNNEIFWYGFFPGEDSMGDNYYHHAIAINKALGTKALDSEAPDICPKCEGTGADYDYSGGYYHEAQGACKECKGTGRIRNQEKWDFTAAAGDAFADPNAGWSSNIDPLANNAYLWHGDPLEAQNVMDNASKVDTDWSNLTDGAGQPDTARMKQAIVNAFRVVLLSPRKDLRWNAIHYQDISGVPADVTDPGAYWNTLEGKRRAWNEAQGIDPSAHMPYYKFLKDFQAIIYQRNPELGHAKAAKLAEETLFDWWTEEQQRIEMDDKDKPSHKQRSADEIERRANEALARRMQLFIKDAYNPKTDMEDTGLQQPLFSRFAHLKLTAEQYNLLTGAPGLKYGAFMGTHLKAIAQISQHADEILQAALKDVQEHDGAGHHFRAAVLALGVPGVGPKVCSFAWLLLQPMTSQLGTIDTHMMDVLGHHYEKEMNNRDYFKFERELAAGRDAAGYSHVPLGAFQWGMWDHKRTGPGSHQDHSAMRVLDPVPHSNIDWVGKATNLKGETWLDQAPDWWQNTQPARDAVAQDWDENIAPNWPQNAIPYQTMN